MKKFIVIILTFVFLVSCGTSVKKEADKDTSVVLENKEADFQVDYSNPAIIAGTDFGNFFKILYAQGNFDEMLKFTSQSTFDIHGKDKIEDFYKNKMKFGYELGKLKSMNQEDGIYTLNYPNSNIMATKKVVRLKVCVENDSTKIILPKELNDFCW